MMPAAHLPGVPLRHGRLVVRVGLLRARGTAAEIEQQ